MKVLSTVDQWNLQGLMEGLKEANLDAETMAEINFWSIELKPKRIRKPRSGDNATTIGG